MLPTQPRLRNFSDQDHRHPHRPPPSNPAPPSRKAQKPRVKRRRSRVTKKSSTTIEKYTACRCQNHRATIPVNQRGNKTGRRSFNPAQERRSLPPHVDQRPEHLRVQAPWDVSNRMNGVARPKIPPPWDPSLHCLLPLQKKEAGISHPVLCQRDSISHITRVRP